MGTSGTSDEHSFSFAEAGLALYALLLVSMSSTRSGFTSYQSVLQSDIERYIE